MVWYRSQLRTQGTERNGTERFIDKEYKERNGTWMERLEKEGKRTE